MRKPLKSLKTIIIHGPSNCFWTIIDLLTYKFGSVFERYYERLISDEYRKEYQTFDITKEDNVLHIGCGPFPLSEIILAQSTNATVVGIDKNLEAIKRAEQVIRRKHLSDRIHIFQGNGDAFPLDEFDFVIISSCANPKIPILEHILRNGKKNLQIILREKEISTKQLLTYLNRRDDIMIVDEIQHHPFPFLEPLGWISYFIRRKK